MEDLIRRLELPDVAILNPSSDDSYAGLPRPFSRRAWWAVVISDLMENLRSRILVAAADRGQAMAAFETQWRLLLEVLEKGSLADVSLTCRDAARNIAPLCPRSDTRPGPIVGLTGEIFVRRDSLSRRYLIRRLAELGFATVCAPVAEWIHYTNFLVEERLDPYRLGSLARLRLRLRNRVMRRDEHRLKAALSHDGIPPAAAVDIGHIVSHAAPYISSHLTGEAVLTVGSALAEIVDAVCGVIAIGPFGCMPNRLSEALLTEAMTREGKLAYGTDPSRHAILADIDNLPFLAIESDGSPFPQLIDAKLETFCLRARILHEMINAP